MSKSQEEKREEFRSLYAEAMKGGGDKAAKRQRDQGKMLARERLEVLLDGNSFFEFDTFVQANEAPGVRQMPGDGVITGRGSIHGRQVMVYSQDFTVMGGSFGEKHAKKIWKVIDIATRVGCPVIGIYDS
ncbi:MAG TPA: carboxyl transferase domain-containing protein, partial [bacterium]